MLVTVVTMVMMIMAAKQGQNDSYPVNCSSTLEV